MLREKLGLVIEAPRGNQKRGLLVQHERVSRSKSQSHCADVAHSVGGNKEHQCGALAFS
jgi:hypothetical protein